MPRLALGTVQFGLDYGVSNKRGRIPADEAFAILDEAGHEHGRVLDTAAAYGTSEDVLGEYLGRRETGFKVVSKYAAERSVPGGLLQQLERTLERLAQKDIYGYLLHSFSDLEKVPGVWEEMIRVRETGLAQKIGFSLYSPEELESLFQKGILFDIVQVPHSVFDRRFAPFFGRLKDKGVEIHTRSVFLQGLAFMGPKGLSGVLQGAGPALGSLAAVARAERMTVQELCLRFSASEPLIDEVVVGVDGLKAWQENVRCFSSGPLSKGIVASLGAAAINDEEILLPFRWGK